MESKMSDFVIMHPMKKQPEKHNKTEGNPMNSGTPAVDIKVASTDELQELINHQSSVIHLKESVIEAQQQRIKMLEEYLRLERARLYARSSEQSSAQGLLFDEVEQTSNENGDQEEKDPPKKKGRGGRKGLSKNIPREQIKLSLTDEEKEGAVNTFYTVVKEELDIIPAKVRVLEYLQEKAVFVENEKRTMKSAALPKRPIPKSIASVGLLAYVIVAKYCDGLPLHRLEKILPGKQSITLQTKNIGILLPS
jgi:transposase